jgi:hypothetical protein
VCTVKLQQVIIMVFNRTPYPPLLTVHLYTVYLFTQERGGGDLNQREGEEEYRKSTDDKAGLKTPPRLTLLKKLAISGL